MLSPPQVYTSGKGSSAAGLTASVTRDPVTVSEIQNIDWNMGQHFCYLVGEWKGGRGTLNHLMPYQ